MNTRSLFMASALMLSSHALAAQRPISLSVGGGATVPLGRFADGADPGWNALVSLGLSSLTQPIGIRVDAQHNRFAGGGDIGVTSATLNLSYRLPMTDSPVSPYVIAGGGAYRDECFDDAGCGTRTRMGWNAGLGSKFASFGLKGFIEARWHAVNASSGNLRFVPVTLALTF